MSQKRKPLTFEEQLASDLRIEAKVRENLHKQRMYATRCFLCGKHGQPLRECCHSYVCDNCHMRYSWNCIAILADTELEQMKSEGQDVTQ